MDLTPEEIKEKYEGLRPPHTHLETLPKYVNWVG